MNAVLSFVISIILAVILALLAARFDKEKQAVAATLGLVIVCIGILVGIYFEMRQLRIDEGDTLRAAVPTLKSEVWRAVVKDIADYDHSEPATGFMGILEDPVRKAIEASLQQATNGVIQVEDKADVVRITSQLMTQARVSVEATSFIDPKEWWNSNIGDNYLADNRAAKRHVPAFTRIFLLGSAEEGRVLTAAFRGQRDLGIDVRYACAGSIPARMLKDFIVIDGAVAAILELDGNRRFRHATFFSTRQMAESVDRDFRDLLYYATPYKDHSVFRCPTPTR